jgi:hypothetical protein
LNKKVLASSILAAVIAGSGLSTHAFAESNDFNQDETIHVTSDEELKKEQSDMTQEEQLKASEQIIDIHKGEEPISRVVDEKTGIVSEVYEVKEEQDQFQTYKSGWQYIGYDFLEIRNNLKWKSKGTENTIAYSGGGDFGVRVSTYLVAPNSVQGYRPLIEFQLMEYDPQNSDDPVGSANGYLGNPYGVTYDIVWRGIGKYVDGTNDKAEFYVKHRENFQRNGDQILRIDYID